MPDAFRPGSNGQTPDGVLSTFFPGSPPDATRLILTQAPAAFVLLDADRRILFSNERDFGDRMSSAILRDVVIGRQPDKEMPRVLIEERAAFVRQAHQSGAMTCVLGMIRGRFTATIYTRLHDDGLGDVVLVLAFPITEFGELGADALDAAAAAGMVVTRARNDDLGELAELTERELQVLRYIGQGLTAAEIGQRLHRAVKTIEGHRVSLGTKLRLKGKADLVRTAIAAGLTTLSDREIMLVSKQARLTRELG